VEEVVAAVAGVAAAATLEAQAVVVVRGLAARPGRFSMCIWGELWMWISAYACDPKTGVLAQVPGSLYGTGQAPASIVVAASMEVRPYSIQLSIAEGRLGGMGLARENE
jgi:hypothetical protein